MGHVDTVQEVWHQPTTRPEGPGSLHSSAYVLCYHFVLYASCFVNIFVC
jgi:hypothetical protein